jgi:DNA-directed RNA polymerase II subunit RPB2
MIDALKPSLEEGEPYQTQEDALSYIGSRGNAGGVTKRERINYAKKILTEDFLPHVSTSPNSEMTKSYFVGYMVYRLINGYLGRASEDDRDHYGKKRLDMAGSMLGMLFHNLFRDFIKQAKNIMKRQVNRGDSINITSAFKKNIIKDGLKYALSTGNWGKTKDGDPAKTGVS